MTRVGLYTENFLFYHEAIKLLKSWSIPFSDVDPRNEILEDIKVIISSDSDPRIWRFQFRGRDPLQALRKAIPSLLGKSCFSSLVVGIDPGPRPGIAVLADQVLLEAFEIVEPKETGEFIQRIIEDYCYRDIKIRLGNGDMPNRIIIERELEREGIVSSIVDESNTSFPHRLHDNALSAARIAMGKFHSAGKSDIRGIPRKQFMEVEFTTLRKILI